MRPPNKFGGNGNDRRMITDISQLDPKGTYTYADYLKWQFDEQVELVKGKLYWTLSSICVVCDLTKLDDDGCLGAPDWVVEITSPRTAKKDFNEKFQFYEQAGVREYWIVQPKEKAINVYVLENDEYQLMDVYESGDIPCQIFPDLIVSHERVFRTI